MVYAFIFIFIIILFVPLFRYMLFHCFELFPLAISDFWHSIWNKPRFDVFGIDMYCGYMGQGKTIKVVDDILKYKKKFPYIHVISNIWLDCDFEWLKDYQQIIDAPPDTIVLIDECSTVFNNRKWKDFPTDLIYLMFQSRKQHKWLVGTAQRFGHIDKSMRDITRYVYQQSNDFWRIHHTAVYDGWEMENCINPLELKPKWVQFWHRSNKMYSQYNTDEFVNLSLTEEFLSSEEKQARLGVQNNYVSVLNKSNKLRKVEKKESKVK